MSDPVTNVEIEDVLSSIRRLVTDTDHTAVTEPAAPAEPEQPAHHFVLTPALRVAQDPAPTPEPVAEDTAPEAEVATLLLGPENAIAARASLEATIAELEAAVTEQPDDFELDGSEVKTEVTWESAGFVSRQALADADDDTHVIAPPDVSQDVEIAEDNASEADATDADIAPILAFRRKVTTPPPVEIDHGDELIEDASQPTLDADAALETYLSGNPAIDEKLLHALVQKVVREELQGHLGERITRNVRKLVRREIHRVLTNQDLT